MKTREKGFETKYKTLECFGGNKEPWKKVLERCVK